ncbi:hypothetical protein [Archangium lipolyticum]|uniref:hypothetical protein n=1 Tax=Archangium lipolyticum TaxID=2970465 RepID=UPI00214A6B2C|nr:hypothetical protein [Archangium lipolyticum]
MNVSRMVVCLLALGLVSACGSGEDGAGRQGRLALRTGRSLTDAPECGVGLPACPDNKSCLSLTLEGVNQVRCLDEANVCTELVSCSGGTTCVILMSYPGQVTCSGRCEGDHCDDSVSSGPLH